MFDRIGRRDDETPFVVEWLVRNGVSVWSVCEGEQRFDNHVDKLTNYIRYWQGRKRENLGTHPYPNPATDRRRLFYRGTVPLWIPFGAGKTVEQKETGAV